MSKCPMCFSRLDANEKAWVCENGSCRTTDTDETASAFFGAEVKERPRYSDSRAAQVQRIKQGQQGPTPWPPPLPACPTCARRMVEACPTCHYALPLGWGEGEVTCVVLSGARATGKSLYIALAVKKLEYLLLAHASSQMQPVTPEIGRFFYDVYTRPLLEERGVLAPTPSSTVVPRQATPLIFDLGMVRGRRRFLMLRDVAGEDMQNLPPSRQHLSFFGRADVVLFLMDPLAVPDVRANLAGVIALPADQGADPVPVLGNVLTLIREGGDGRPTPPVGVVVSKFDALEEFRGATENPSWQELMAHRGAAFARDPSDRGIEYDETDGDLLSAEVRSLVLKLGGAGVVALLENPAHGRSLSCRYFAVSVLGHAPRGQHLDARGIAPFRVTDPLKWALSLPAAR